MLYEVITQVTTLNMVYNLYDNLDIDTRRTIQNLNDIRITSYNVCYTKLLRR